MASSSSAKKVARLASRGKGKKVRFQGGSIFPIAVALVVVLGLLLILYGRQSRPSDGSGVPRVNDGSNIDAHWHAAFGIYICDTFQPKITGTLEETGIDSTGASVLLNDKFKILGIHSHGDGIIHYHPASTKSSGNRAKLGVFLDSYNIKLSDTELIMPADQGGKKWSTKDFKCDGKDTQLTVRVWDHYNDTATFHDVVTDFNNTRITNDGMVFVVAFVPKGTDIPQPDWASQLPTLGAADGGAVIATTTTIANGSTPSTSTSTSISTGDTTAGTGGATSTSVATGDTGAVSTSTTAPATTTTGG
ncbi:MAG: hypothetical protein JJD93_17365 [Ilumatobacteraceae bacterium]|nr:hypothetical protein [Ilumatobacteraceae bacterium]